MGKPVLWLGLSAAMLLLSGCTEGFFSAHGTVDSIGGNLGDWSAVPAACTRDSVLGTMEGEPAGDARRTVLTFLWHDTLSATGRPDVARAQESEHPLRLAIVSRGTGYEATLATRRLPYGTYIPAGDCRVFTVERHEASSPVPGSRPVLDGHVQMDCRADGTRRIVADVRFENCAW